MSLAFGPHRFRSTVPYYAAHRVPYPDGLISFVAERCGLARASRCSTLAADRGSRAPRVAVTAMDPEPDMLAAAAKVGCQSTWLKAAHTISLLVAGPSSSSPWGARFIGWTEPRHCARPDHRVERGRRSFR